MDKSKQYPNDVLEKALVARGIDVRCMWQVKGPKDTAIAWLECFFVGRNVVIVQTFKDGNGWNAFTPNLENNVEATIQDVIDRCQAKPNA